MEIIAEILFGIFEVIIGTIWEVIIQIIGEIAFEIGLRGVANVVKPRKDRNPIVTTIGYLILGVVFGFLVTWIIPDSQIESYNLRILNLLIAPILAGAVMAIIGKMRSKRGQELIRLDTFGYGYTFALGFALIRFFFAK